MSKKHSKAIFFLGALSLLTHSFADNRSGYNYPARDVDTKTECSKTSRGQMDQMMMDRPITPDAGPRVARGADVFVSADFIYWSVREDGLAFAYNGALAGSTSVVSSVNVSQTGTVFHPDFGWKPGFKVGLGLNLDHDGWDIFAQYTWIRSNTGTTSRSNSVSNTTNVLKAGGADAVFESLTFASGKWNLHYNVIDLEMGRNFYVSKFLTTRPFIGLKGSWQEDNLLVNYQWFDSTNAVFKATRIRNNVDYWGVGVRAGMDNAWYFFRNFCLFGNFAFSGLWSHYEVIRKDFGTPDLASPGIFFLNLSVKDVYKSLKGVVELVIGLRYDVWWSNDDYHFGIQAGWEEQLWISQSAHWNSIEETAHGDLALQGLTIEARLDF